SLWHSYYDQPGNKVYMEKNRPGYMVQEHRKYLEFVFRPSMRDSLHSLPPQNDDILDNLLYIQQHERELRAYTDTVASSAYLEQCIGVAKQFLPKGKYNPIPNNLTIYIMAMAFDGAVQDSSMYFGLARVYEYDRFRKGALAGHEMHHQMRVQAPLKSTVSTADAP